MTQIDTNTYATQLGERVSVVVTAFGTINASNFAVDSPLLSSGPPSWTFDVISAAGHNGVFNLFFPPGSPANARYSTRLGGSFGGDFQGPSADANGLLQPGVSFQVA
jgi:hypothetical protein